MTWKRRAAGGLIGFVGYMLSPLSWWNDLFVNVPIAVAFGWVISLIYKPAFNAAVIVGYLSTNILGLVLMHKGMAAAASGEFRRYSRSALIKDLLVCVLYTGVILLLIHFKVLQPVTDYLK